MQRIGGAAAGHESVIFDFTSAAHVNTSAALAIEELIEIAGETAKGIIVCGLSGGAKYTREALGVLQAVGAEYLVADRTTALRLARDLLADSA